MEEVRVTESALVAWLCSQHNPPLDPAVYVKLLCHGRDHDTGDYKFVVIP